MLIQTVNESFTVSNTVSKKEMFFSPHCVNNHLHFLFREPNNRQSLHHSFPIILVTDRADPGAVPLNKTIGHYNIPAGKIPTRGNCFLQIKLSNWPQLAKLVYAPAIIYGHTVQTCPPLDKPSRHIGKWGRDSL